MTQAHRNNQPSSSHSEDPPAPSASSGFRRYELWLLAAGLAGIFIWGFTGTERKAPIGGQDSTSISEPRPVDSANATASPGSVVARGQAVFEANGCAACHSIDGTRKIGPSLKGVWGSQQVHVDGSTAVMDEEYFVESVLEPQARVIEGYGSAMPSYQDLVTPQQLTELAAYVKSLQ